MKSLLTLLSILTISISIAQNFETVEDVNNKCTQLAFMANEEAEMEVDKILKHLGLPRNFIVTECPNINNALAIVLDDEHGTKVRYILYDNNFFNRISNRASSGWAATSILAHEIGHHLSGHALTSKGSNHKFELEADEFSGFVLAKMGASLEQAQSAIQTLRYEKASATHPAKADRLIAIKKGWENAAGKKVKITDYTLDEEDLEAEEYFRKGNEYFNKEEYKDAKYWFEKAAEKDNAYAMNKLGIIHFYGLDVEEDYSKAFYWYEKGAEKGNAFAMDNLAKSYLKGLGVTQDYFQYLDWSKKAIEELNKLAEDGDLDAMSRLGFIYSHGLNVTENRDLGYNWFKRAAENGSIRAMRNLGYLYLWLNNDGVKSIYWYEKAAEKGDVEAIKSLEYIYWNGKGVKKDSVKEKYWSNKRFNIFKKEAEKGNAKAMSNLGYMYRRGLGVSQDYSQAKYWYEKAIEKGYAPAMFDLGLMYFNGEGVTQDYSQAKYWYEKSAEKGNTIAMFDLGRMYERGRGVTKNINTAIKYYQMACDKGDKDGCDKVKELR